MKKHWKVLLTVGLVAVMAFGAIGSAAWFTDQDTDPVSLAAGKIKVELVGADANGITVVLGSSEYFMGGLAPGVWDGPYYVDVYNKGWGESTLPIKHRWTSQRTGGNTAMWDLMKVRVYHGHCSGSLPNLVYEGLLKNLNLDSTTYAVGGGILNPGNTHCFKFKFMLKSSAGDSLQAKVVNFNLVLDATQEGNSGWGQ